MGKRKSENLFFSASGRVGMARVFLVLIFALMAGWMSFALAVSGTARIKAPQTALMFVPYESTALAGLADQLLLANPTKPPLASAKLATKSLEQQALNAKAIRILGYLAQSKGKKARSLALVKLAERLSRREPGAQLWLIEHYAQVGDTIKTLNHYDILLTTEPDTRGILFPLLSSAIEDGAVRSALLPYVRQNKPWMGSFLWYVIGESKDVTSVVNLISESKGFPTNEAGNNTSREQQRTLLSRLVSELRFADAQRIYRLVPGANPAALTNPTFDDSDREARFGAMGWTLADDPNAGGGFAETTKGKLALTVFANAATTRIVASRLLYLQPGQYRFAASLSDIERGEGGYLLFQLRCPRTAAAKPAWILPVNTNRVAAQLDVPEKCPVQFLDIVASGGKGQLGLEATVSSLSITH